MGQEAYEAAQGAAGEGLDARVFEAAVEILDQTGWTCGTLGLDIDESTGTYALKSTKHPRCANGVLIGAYSIAATDPEDARRLRIDPYSAYKDEGYRRYAAALVEELGGAGSIAHAMYGDGKSHSLSESEFLDQLEEVGPAFALEKWNDYCAPRDAGGEALREALERAAEGARA